MKKLAVPGKGLKVINPKTKRYLKDEGEVVVVNRYWIRRQLEKSVVLKEVVTKPISKNDKKEIKDKIL